MVWSLDGPPPSDPFKELKVLEPAKAYKNRHASVLLAFDATVAALETIEKKTPQPN